ncbi:hypothetical protein BZA70DRAFT_282245 [Myxozyma melibiosi]|uniref:SRR1-like domain-containing protein n=1 Tax=Myxozyma melibiosi TaxID=54550 RepID=A0ABR1F409_9ASCO
MAPLIVSQSTDNAELLACSQALDAAALREREQFTLVVSKSRRKRDGSNKPSDSSSAVHGGSRLVNDAQQIESDSKDAQRDGVRQSRRRKNAQSSKYKARAPRTADDYVSLVHHQLGLLKRQKIFHQTLLGSENERTVDSVLFQALGNKASEVSHIRCLALGRITESDYSAMQLALLLAIKEAFGLRNITTTISCYDPDFTPLDIETLEKLEISVEVDDPGEEAKLVDESYGAEGSDNAKDSEDILRVTGKREATLYYMPHAPIGLVDKIMGLPGVRFVLGNDVLGYKDRLWGKVELMHPSLRKVISDCLDVTSETDESRSNHDRWARERLNDGLARDESWWMSVNDLAMHWRV